MRTGLYSAFAHRLSTIALASSFILCSTSLAQTTRPVTTRAVTTRPASQPAGDFKLRGRVLDDADEPVEGAEVRNWQSDSKTETDAAGRFVFEDVPVVKGSLWIHQDGFVGENREFTMPPDGRLPEMIIKLRRLGSINGIVVGPDGQTPIAEAAISTGRNRNPQAETGADGHFVLADLNPGTLTLLAWSDEYTIHRQTVQVAAGRTTADVKITLSKRGGTLTGKVIDPDAGGEPVAGAFVVAFPIDLNERTPGRWELQHLTEKTILSEGYTLNDHVWFPAKADDQGEFKIEHAPPSRYLLCLFPRRGPLLRKENIEVKEGETTAPVTIESGKRPPGYVTGAILMPNGDPLANTEFHLRQEYKRGSSSGTSSYSDKTDADGRYYVMVDRPGRQTLSFEIEGYATATKSLDVDRADAVPPEQDITLEPRKAIATTQPEEENAGPTSAIAGKVFLPDGQTPAAGVPVKPYVKNRSFPGGSQGSTFANNERYEWREDGKVQTGADGTFVIENLPPGRYGVFADTRMEGHFNTEGLSPELALTLPTLSPEVDVKANEQTRDVRIVMSAAGTATGIVRNSETQEPIPNANVSLNEQRSSSWFGSRPKETPFNTYMSHSATTDQEGRFWIWGVKPGSYSANAYLDGFESAQNKAVTIKAGQQTTFPDVLLKPQPIYAGPATGSIAGQVFLPDGKTPAAGAMIGPAATARFPGGEARWKIDEKQWFLRMAETTVTGPDGAFTVDTLPAGQYRVYVQPHPEQPMFIDENHSVKKPIAELLHTRAAWSAALEVKAGEPIKGVKIVLTAAGAVAGQLVDAETNAPIEGHIWIMPSGFRKPDPEETPEFRSPSFVVDKDGTFQMPGLLPGKYDINISAQGNYQPANKRGQIIKAGETLKLDLKLKPRGK